MRIMHPAPHPALEWRTQTGAGALFAAMGNGDPVLAVSMMDQLSLDIKPNDITGGNVTTPPARCVKFRLPKTLELSDIRLLGIAVTTNEYKIAIYRAITSGARIWESGVFSTPSLAWKSFSPITGVTLQAYTDYYFAITANSASVTAGLNGPRVPVRAALFGAGAAPLGNRSLGIAEYVNFTTESGVLFPATLPAIGAINYGNSASQGSVPVAFLEGTAF